jgi:hypothetical protein
MSEQLELPVDDQPYFLHYRDYCDTWEVRARAGWGLKEFDTRQEAKDALGWLLADHRQSGQVRRLYPKEAPHSRKRPSR